MNIFREQFVVVPLDDVLKFYAAKFRVEPPGEIINWEAFVDTAKHKVIFNLILEEPKKEKS